MIAKPRIFVFDAAPVAAELSSRNFHVRESTFGAPFTVPKDNSFSHVPFQVEAPGLTEADLVVADLASPAPTADRPDEDPPAPGVNATWSSHTNGVVDPRPFGMYHAHDLIERMFDHGGVVILIAAARHDEPYVKAAVESTGRSRRLDYPTETPLHNWGLCRAANNFRVVTDSGVDMTPTEAAQHVGLGRTEQWHGHFRCTITPSEYSAERWIPLARNKYGHDVGGILCPRTDTDEGWLIILPPLDNIETIVADLIERELPRLAPRIFPAAHDASWLNGPEYEHDDVLAYRSDIAAIRQKAEADVLAVEQKMAEARDVQAHLHTLLTGTGDDLVNAVITTLTDLGFSDVVDVDEKKKAEGDETIKREDIHVIEDTQPLVLGEIKGIEGLPKEANSLQVAKYLMPRVRELDRTDIRGLSIVNHQRGMLPQERNHETVFQEDVLVNAEEQGITLLTGWELFRLARNTRRHGWAFETIRDIFYTNGRPEIVPSHYILVGTVDKVWPQASAFAITLTEALDAGARIAAEGPVDFYEFAAASIRLDDADVDRGEAGQRVGIACGDDIAAVREGRRVFVVSEPS